mmetsp:Transcript_2174/g.7769  ORF Transcript_2174/g.7769 Transcript_2174/m.7769 type:complete len:209 (+) Transcript_2174:1770-2396(+)
MYFSTSGRNPSYIVRTSLAIIDSTNLPTPVNFTSIVKSTYILHAFTPTDLHRIIPSTFDAFVMLFVFTNSASNNFGAVSLFLLNLSSSYSSKLWPFFNPSARFTIDGMYVFGCVRIIHRTSFFFSSTSYSGKSHFRLLKCSACAVRKARVFFCEPKIRGIDRELVRFQLKAHVIIDFFNQAKCALNPIFFFIRKSLLLLLLLNDHDAL